MNMSIRMGDMWRSLPPGASTFLKRAALLFAAWKLLYILVLLPMREPDGWLVSSVGESTAGTLNLFKGDGHYRVRHEYAPHRPAGRPVVSKSYVYREGRRPDIGIAAPCNGLELMVLAVGFILCFEAGWRRKAIYVSASLVGVYAVNVARCSLLTVIKTEHPVYFVFAHKYLFNIAGYGFVFLIWMWYVQGLIPKPAVAASGSGVR